MESQLENNLKSLLNSKLDALGKHSIFRLDTHVP